jgi:hypothetical protein
MYREAKPLVADWFEVREVTITGISHVTRQEVLERLAVPPRATVLSVDPEELATRLQTHPWVKASTVVRRFPHTLAVVITERRPTAILRSPLTTLLLDEEASVLSALPNGEEPRLPVLVGLDPTRLVKGDTSSRQAAQAGIKLAGLLREAFEDQPEVDVSRPDQVVAYVQRFRFQFGPTSFEEQWRRYRQVEPALRASAGRAGQETNGACAARGATAGGCPEIDLRYQTKVIVRERG